MKTERILVIAVVMVTLTVTLANATTTTTTTSTTTTEVIYSTCQENLDSGLNYMLRGYITGYTYGVPYNRPDNCLGSFILNETLCTGSYPNEVQVDCRTLSPPGIYICRQGACSTSTTTTTIVYDTTSTSTTTTTTTTTIDILPDSCNENIDAWIDPYRAGYINGISGGASYNRPDRCLNSGLLNETYCNGASPRDTLITCNCANNRCYNCTDTDGGKNYYVKGVVTSIWQSPPTREDYCFNDWPQAGYKVFEGKYLLENYCTANEYPMGELVNCSYGCRDGACRSTPMTTTTVPSTTSTVMKSATTLRSNVYPYAPAAALSGRTQGERSALIVIGIAGLVLVMLVAYQKRWY